MIQRVIVKMNLAILVALFTLPSLAETKIDPALKAFATGPQNRKTQVILLLEIPTGGASSPRRYDRVRLAQNLRGRSDRAMRLLESHLRANRSSSRDVQIRKVFPLSLTASANVSPAGLRLLGTAPSVLKIYANHEITHEIPRDVRRVSRFAESSEVPYHFETSGLMALIKEMPQFTGKGVVVGHIDTGVDGKHPALMGKITAYFDGRTGRRTDQPTDMDEHGTHTAGTILGGTRSTENMIGVAPEATMVSAGALGSWEEMLKGMEFMLDPDSNPNTADQPRLVSNSWNSRGAPDQEPFYRMISTWEAAGILPVFSAGNSGPNPQTITPPHEHPEAFAVAATGEGLKIADFSSRGPGIFRGQETQKPDIAAPGVQVYSAVPGGRYAKMSGTSMATPHVAGAAALVLQANPDLNPAQIRAVLLQSSIMVTETGASTTVRAWNPLFGFGNLDIQAAVKAALLMKDGVNPFAIGGSRFLNNGLFTNPRTLPLEATLRTLPTRTIDDSWKLVRQDDAKNGWLTLKDL